VMEKLVLQAEFPDLPGMQIDSGGYAGLAHVGLPIDSFLSTKVADQAAAFVERRVLHRTRLVTQVSQTAYLMLFISASTIFTTLAGNGTKPRSSAIFWPLFKDHAKKSTTAFCLAASEPFSYARI